MLHPGFAGIRSWLEPLNEETSGKVPGHWFAFIAALSLLLAFVHPTMAQNAAAPVTPAQIDDAVKKGVDFLWSNQKPQGRWEDQDRVGDLNSRHWEGGGGDAFGGFSALSVYALLAADAKKNDPRMVKALDFLEHADVVGTYSLGLRCQVWLTMGNTAETRALLAADIKRLESGLIHSGDYSGLWSYFITNTFDAGRIDHSVSQYGVLGLWAGSQLDVPIPLADWKMIDAAWRKQQDNDGGWTYAGGGGSDGSTATMTAAGIASLFIAQDMVRGTMAAPGDSNYSDPKIDGGLKWVGDHFVEVNTNYNWYGVERIGAASGYKYFGKVDWFARGAQALVSSQQPDGSWNSGGNGNVLTDTAFALLFLCHGRAPVMMNKLDYAFGADGGVREATWNVHHRDVANLARFTGRNMEVVLNWQIVNLASPVEDWHEAPILYLEGTKALELTPYEESKLKLFVEQGGLIVANADAVATTVPKVKYAFPDSVRALGHRLFGYDFRPLPPTHPILADQSYRSNRWPGDPGIEGLSNGVRELMVLLTNDPGRAWQNNLPRNDAAKFELGTDIFLYAVDKQDLRSKGQTYIVHASAPVKRVVPVARLWVGGNPDPEPGGWRRLSAITTNANGTALDVRYVKLGDGSLLRSVPPTTAPTTTTSPAAPSANQPAASAKFRIAHLTGTTAFKLNAAQRKELADFTAGGGTLIVDAAGGSTEFADAAETELAAIFGGTPKDLGVILPATHPVYHMPAMNIKAFGWRLFARSRMGHVNGPLVRAIEEGDHATLFYSRQDLSTGMVGESVDGVVGYDSATATAIMRNLVLYSTR